MSASRIVACEELPTSDARWITLKKLTYTDPDGKQRPWEMAERTTRSSSGIDAVAIFALIRSRKNSFPVSTVIIEQYRPPIDKITVELPAGLIDEGETPETTAIRELEEETGFKADGIIGVSQTVCTDPGMSNSNMKLVTVSVWFDDEIQTPVPKLEPGECIETRVVPISKLYDELQEYHKKGFGVGAKLSHFVDGYQLALKLTDEGLA
ncbi:hypothetical protein MD484_g4410, partial [Candolleomyces efflorescens]